MFNPNPSSEKLDTPSNQTESPAERKKRMEELFKKNLAKRAAQIAPTATAEHPDPVVRQSLIDFEGQVTLAKENTEKLQKPSDLQKEGMETADFFAKYAMTDKWKRTSLEEQLKHYFNIPHQVAFEAEDGHRLAISKLYKNEKSVIDTSVITAIADDPEQEDLAESLNVRLQGLDECSWLRITALCDAAEITDAKYFDALHTAAKTIVKDSQAEKNTRFHAYLFLKSQNQYGEVILDNTLASILKEKIKDKNIFYTLMSSFHMYDAESAIAELFEDRGFEVEEYYDLASPAFQALERTAMGMQLYYYLNHISNPNDNKQAKILERIKDMHEKLADDPKAYSDNVWLLVSRLAYQVLEEQKRPEDSLLTKLTSGHYVIGKDITTCVLKYLIKHLINHKKFSSANTLYSHAPFAWGIYSEAYVGLKHLHNAKKRDSITQDDLDYTSEKTAKLNTWMTEQVFTKENQSFKKALLLLPLELRHVLFDFEGSAINPETLEPWPNKKYEVKKRTSFLGLGTGPTTKKQEEVTQINIKNSGPCGATANNTLTKYNTLTPIYRAIDGKDKQTPDQKEGAEKQESPKP